MVVIEFKWKVIVTGNQENPTFLKNLSFLFFIKKRYKFLKSVYPNLTFIFTYLYNFSFTKNKL